MAQENVELVCRLYEADERGDYTAVFTAYDPEIEWHVLGVAEFGFDPVYVGHDGVRTFWRLWLGVGDDEFRVRRVHRRRRARRRRQSQRMRGRTSGIELEWNSYAQGWTIQDAKVVRMDFFPTRRGALEAVGLSE